MFSVVQMNFVPGKQVSRRVFNGIGLYIQSLTQLLENTTREMVVTVAKLSNSNLSFLVRLCIVTLIMFLSISIDLVSITILTLATHANMINIVITSSRGNLN